MKKYRGAIILSVILLTLIGVAYWDERQTKKDEDAKSLENRIFSLKSEDIARISYIEPTKNVSFELVKEDLKWKIISPFTAPADETVVNGFIKTLIDYKFEKVVSESKDKWSDFGVQSPQRIISLSGRDGKTEQVYVGNQAPIGYNAFFRTDDSGKVYVGSQYLITSTGKTIQEFRDKSIPAVETSAVKTFRYLVGGEEIFEAEQTNGKFSIVKPEGVDGDHGEISSFISEIRRSKAEDFNDAPAESFEKAFEVSKAAFAMEWTIESGEKGGWKVAAIKDDFWVKPLASSSYYKVSSDTIKSLRRELKDFRNRQIATYDTSEVVGVQVDEKVFEKKSGGFVEKDGSEPKAHIQNLISDIAWSKAEGIAEAKSPQAEAAAGAAQHQITLNFDSKLNRQPLVLGLWNDPKEPRKFVVRSSDAKSLLIVSKDVFANIKEAEQASNIDDMTDEPASEDVDNGT